MHLYPLWLLITPWIGAILVAILGKGHYPLTRWLSLGPLLLSAALLAILAQSSAGLPALISVPWISKANAQLAVGIDALSMPFLINVLGVSIVSVWYGWGYLRNAARPHICFALMLAFSGSMIGTLLAHDLYLFFIFWEGMLVTSALLLGGWGEGDRVGGVTLKYFLYTQAGSLLILVGLTWLVAVAGSSDMTTIARVAPTLDPTVATWMAGAMLVGFALKMAIFPLHTWLPDAHSVAPMPVTVLLAAAMLAMGAYGILRVPVTLLGQDIMMRFQIPLMVLALVSEVHGAFMSLASKDVKRIVAYSSVSQMGYILFALATFTGKGLAGGILHVMNHGILKAALFMGTGIVIRGTSRRSIDDIGQLAHVMPATSGAMAVAALAISGLPPLCAFHSEWLILSGGIASTRPVIGYLQFAAPVLTAAYAIWYVIRLSLGQPSTPMRIRRTTRAMRWSFYATILTALAVGLYPSPVYETAFRAAEQIIGAGWR